MATNWKTVGANAAKAALGVLNTDLPIVQSAVEGQVASMVTAGKFIATHKPPLGDDELMLMQRMQERAMSGVLLAFEGIGVVVAEQAAAAAWAVIQAAITAAAGL